MKASKSIHFTSERISPVFVSDDPIGQHVLSPNHDYIKFIPKNRSKGYSSNRTKPKRKRK